MQTLAKNVPQKLIALAGLGLFAPAAIAHDMANVLVAYGLVLAIPIPGLLLAWGWKKTLIGTLPICAIALFLANFGSYGLMYAVLFSPYAAWLLRVLIRPRKASKHEV